MDCPYCEVKTNEFNPVNQTVKYSGIELALNRQGILRVRAFDFHGDPPTIGFTAQDVVEIKYCPMCGKRFINN